MERVDYEVIILGGGVMGSVTAYYLSKYLGKDVLLLEQYDLLHRRGSSHGDSRLDNLYDCRFLVQQINFSFLSN